MSYADGKMDGSSFRNTMSSLNYGNVMEAAARDVMKEKRRDEKHAVNVGPIQYDLEVGPRRTRARRPCPPQRPGTACSPLLSPLSPLLSLLSSLLAPPSSPLSPLPLAAEPSASMSPPASTSTRRSLSRSLSTQRVYVTPPLAPPLPQYEHLGGIQPCVWRGCVCVFKRGLG